MHVTSDTMSYKLANYTITVRLAMLLDGISYIA